MNYTEYQQLYSKDVMQLLNVQKRTAEQCLRDIKQTYQLKKVLFFHFKDYFKLK